MNNEILSKCCNAAIRIGRFESVCCECGNSVNPDDGIPYNNGQNEHPETEEYQPTEEEIHNFGG